MVWFGSFPDTTTIWLNHRSSGMVALSLLSLSLCLSLSPYLFFPDYGFVICYASVQNILVTGTILGEMCFQGLLLLTWVLCIHLTGKVLPCQEVLKNKQDLHCSDMELRRFNSSDEGLRCKCQIEIPILLVWSQCIKASNQL